MKSKYDYDNVIEAAPRMDHHTYIIVCKYPNGQYDRFTSNDLKWAQSYKHKCMIINLNVWPKHKKGIII